MFFVLSLFLLTSCDEMETVVEIDIPPHEPMLVLISIIDTESEIRVLVSHSVGAYEQSIPSCIIDAEVLLYENGDFIDTLSIDMLNPDTINVYSSNRESYIIMNYYKSNYIPNNNSSYTIKVNHPEYESITASTYIPQDIVINDVYVDTLANDESIGVSFSFNDNGNQQNYYRLKMFSKCTKTWIDEYGYEEEYGYTGHVEMMSNDPSFPRGIPFDGYTFYGNEVIFTDDLFNGQEKNISIDVDSDGFRYSDCDTVIIKFSTFSDDTYTYYNSLGDHIDKGELGIFGGEVIPVFSNVENGLGVLISINAQQIYVKP